MTSRAGETFAVARALADIEELLAGPVPATGPTVAEGDPETGEWTATGGEGFRVVPLWEGDPLTGVYAPEWNDAEDAAEAHLAALVGELDRRWGPHRAVPLLLPLLRRQEGAPSNCCSMRCLMRISTVICPSGARSAARTAGWA